MPEPKSKRSAVSTAARKYCSMGMSYWVEATTAPAKRPKTSASAVSAGITSRQASSRGVTNFLMGSAPSAAMASICSVTRIEPSSAVMPEPMRPPTVSAVSTGPSSRKSVNTTTLPTVCWMPKRAMKKANCRVITSPAKTAVRVAMESERAPSATTW